MTKASASSTLRAAWTALFRPSTEVAISGRSSHSVSVIKDTAYIFSGELTPRIPVEQPPPVISLLFHRHPESDMGLPLLGIRFTLLVDVGGPDMSPLESTLYAFGAEKQAMEYRRDQGNAPQLLAVSTLLQPPTDSLYLFGGCPEKGRLNDLHRFDISTSQWTQLPTHPDISVRGGFNGHELDDLWIFDIPSGKWEAATWSPDSIRPVARSALDKIAVFYGECDPSAIGHSGAGKYLDDVQLLSFDEQGRAILTPIEVQDTPGKPSARGWVAAAPWKGESVVMFGGYDGTERDNGLYVLSFSS
ncbi:hypothetical protein BC829DRAFT_443537 [Chytridium lagenaria]|nr:hypothetical protein BC829DRAFT_443537 [Chytridium lagenaria]